MNASKLHRCILQFWYPKNSTLFGLYLPLYLLFAPLSLLYWVLFKLQFRLPKPLTAPVIVVGNIAVGGTGKTPLVIALVEYLTEKKVRVGVISRGYKGTITTGSHIINPRLDQPQYCGDEPFLIAQRFEIPVAIGSDRAQNAKRLIEEFAVQCIVSDDGLQHYPLKRDFEIAVVDGSRMFGNSLLLPAGPLREWRTRLKSVDTIIINGEQRHHLGAKVRVKASPMTIEANALVQLSTKKRFPLLHFAQQEVRAFAGIGNPQSFFTLLKRYQMLLEQFPLPNHYDYRDLSLLDSSIPIVTTEKDAVKIMYKPVNLDNIYFLEITAQLERKFLRQIDTLIEQNIPL